MDYEKKYKEALERATELNNRENASILLLGKGLEYIFPELKEGEGERIRKEILDYCKNKAEKYPNDPKYKNISAWITWLEKQSEEARNIALRTEYEKGRADAIAEMRKPSWSEKDEKMLKETLAFIETVEDINKAKDGFLDVKIWLKSLRPQNTWKPSEEQMQYLVGAIEESGGSSVLQELYDQLKKLKEE